MQRVDVVCWMWEKRACVHALSSGRVGTWVRVGKGGCWHIGRRAQGKGGVGTSDMGHTWGMAHM